MVIQFGSPLETSVDEILHRLLVHKVLRGVRVVHVVERERLVRAQPGLRLAGRLRDARLARLDDFARQLRPDAGGDADAARVAIGRIHLDLCFKTFGPFQELLIVCTCFFHFLFLVSSNLFALFRDLRLITPHVSGLFSLLCVVQLPKPPAIMYTL